LKIGGVPNRKLFPDRKRFAFSLNEHWRQAKAVDGGTAWSGHVSPIRRDAKPEAEYRRPRHCDDFSTGQSNQFAQAR
jgi:hypothetical protein